MNLRSLPTRKGKSTRHYDALFSPEPYEPSHFGELNPPFSGATILDGPRTRHYYFTVSETQQDTGIPTDPPIAAGSPPGQTRSVPFSVTTADEWNAALELIFAAPPVPHRMMDTDFEIICALTPHTQFFSIGSRLRSTLPPDTASR